ncbi:sugar ABC transporter permease [uncultured Acetatifactor sp.]|uniref:ABC transporter permease n=1 Tax=uncultured Acetatifactor sp. TaxID=1671927 RepID=UPI00262B5E45|nr:ABC transporter permease subunit [uncultured Acetatifactor sp.]
MQKTKKRPGHIKRQLKRYSVLYVILLLAIVYYFVFMYVPLIWGVEISFKDMKIGSTIQDAPWVGWKNYKYFFQNKSMLKLLRNTLIISINSMIWGFLPPILLTIAIFDLRSKKYQKFCQTMVYIPHFFSWVIIYGIVFAFFSGNGFVNGIIRALGGTEVGFLTSKKAFLPLLIGTQIWQSVGWSTILYFAALTSVDTELYDAAKIDGAGPIQRIRAVTFPAMKPVITFSLIMSLGGVLGTNFEQIMMFYNSALYDVADVIDTWVYRVGLGQMQYGYGTATSMMRSVVGLVLMVSANTISKKVSGRGMF